VVSNSNHAPCSYLQNCPLHLASLGDYVENGWFVFLTVSQRVPSRSQRDYEDGFLRGHSTPARPQMTEYWMVESRPRCNRLVLVLETESSKLFVRSLSACNRAESRQWSNGPPACNRAVIEAMVELVSWLDFVECFDETLLLWDKGQNLLNDRNLGQL
jgi:hypothetical protein